MPFKYAGFTLMMPDLTIPESAALLKELGYDGVEWRVHSVPAESSKNDTWRGNKATIDIDTIEETADDIKKLCDDNGLEIISLGTYLSYNMLDDLEKCMAAAKKMGCHSIRMSTPKYDSSKSYNDILDAAISGFSKVEKLAEKYRVRANIELHNGVICPGASSAYMLVSEFDPDHIGVIVDPGNMVTEGYEDWHMGFDVLGPYLAHVHVKNTALVQCDGVWKSKVVPLDKGIVSWRSVLKALNDVGYNGWLAMEDLSTDDTKTKLKRGIEYLKSIEPESAE